EADRRDRALRDEGPRRGPDHRAGRDPRLAPRHGRRPGAPRPRRRARGALARGALAPRRPRARLRQQDRRLLVISGPTNIRLVRLGLIFAVGAGAWALTCAAWRFDRVAAGVVPLDPREFARLTVVVLGSGGPHPDPNRRGPAVALGAGKDVVLVDAG